MTDSPVELPRTARTRSLIGWLRLIVAALLLALLVWCGVKAVRIGPATRGLVADLRALQAADLESLASLDREKFQELREHFASLEGNLAIVRAEARPFLPIMSRLQWLPGVGAEAAAAPALLEMAGAVAVAGRASLDGAIPVLASLSETETSSALASLSQAIQETAPDWEEAGRALAEVAAARQQLTPETLDPRLRAQIERLDGYLPLLKAGTGMATLMPILLGEDGSRTYLLLAQNSDELRATGGFISGVGQITLQKGEIVGLEFQDSYRIYSELVNHPPAPPALERYMQAQILLFRDANWSPDFPTTAAVAQSLYQLNTGGKSDGIIAFDLEATRRLVTALEPLSLPGYEKPVTSANLFTALRAVWAAPTQADSAVGEQYKSDWWLHRKDFMADLARAALGKLESGDVDFGKLARAMYSSLEEKHLLISLSDQTGRALLAETGWDGALHPAGHDYLLVVDSNVGWNKVNPLIKRSTHYQVTLGADGSLQGDLSLTYLHGGEANQEPCQHTSRYGDSYEDMVHRCYYNYARVYVPGGTELLSAEGFQAGTVEALPGERGTVVLAGLLVLPPGQEQTVHLSYRLSPKVATEATYQLLIQKQPGTPAWPIEVSLMVAGASEEPGAQPATVWHPITPNARTTEAGTSYSMILATDTEVVVARTTRPSS